MFSAKAGGLDQFKQIPSPDEKRVYNEAIRVCEQTIRKKIGTAHVTIFGPCESMDKWRGIVRNGNALTLTFFWFEATMAIIMEVHC